MRYKGRLGMIRAPVLQGNATPLVLTQRTGAVYWVSDVATRIARALADGAETSDFTITDSTGNSFAPTSIVSKPTMEFGLNVTAYPVGPYSLVASTNARVYSLANVGGFRTFTLDTGQDTQDVTEFGAKWREFEVTLAGWTATASGFWKDPTFTVGGTTIYLTAGQINLDETPFVISFFPQFDTAAGVYHRFVGLAEIEGGPMGAEVDGILTKEIRIRGVGPLYFRID